MQYRLLLLLMLCIFSNDIVAQRGTIEGLITDADSQTPLSGATINISGSRGDNSDIFGRFIIPAVNPGQYEMVISHIGYKTEFIPVEVKADLRSSINVMLKKAGLDLSEVRISSKKNSALNAISAVDIRLRPVNTSQDVLRIVPGLFIAQHAGGGKAEQIFLRGYDIDHGTDIAVTVDGMPVNMVSHAHGQGYADLHFLIPETVEKAGFDKGPYFASRGNLATAAYVDFSTKDFLDKNSIKAEAGQFNTQRLSALLKVFTKTDGYNKQQFYVASEYARTDGYFKSPQDFHRFNIMGKYTGWFGNQAQLSISASTFDSKWNASGQVPDRAVQAGIIDRFGAIDDTEGGYTGRTNLNIRFSKQWKNNWKTASQLYYSRYRFSLYSNFTFFLEDPVNGDMIHQKEQRDILGYNMSASRSYLIGNKRATTETGAGFRYDNVNDIELSKATRQTFFNYMQKGDVRELNSFAFISQDIDLGSKLSLNAALRFDHFIFRYKDELAGAIDFSSKQKSILSPKLNFTYTPNVKLKFYLNNGIGFHSNDSRVILDNSAEATLPKVIGTDIGVIAKPTQRLILKTTLWHFYSQQEFVYVGDAGIVEPGGKTRRMGVDVSARYQFNKWLFGDIDVNITRARAIGEAKGADYIPLAPSFTSIGGLTVKTADGFSGSLRYRYIHKRPANETNTIVAQGYYLLDAVAAYRLKRFEISVSAENMLNVKWREAQFATESRLRTEADPVEEIHYTPGTPRFIKASLTFNF